MPESELFKIVMQGGMLGLWVCFGWWALFRGVPMLKEQVDKMTSSHQATVEKISTDNRANITDINDCYRNSVEAVTKECREERKEVMALLYAKLGPSGNAVRGT